MAILSNCSDKSAHYLASPANIPAFARPARRHSQFLDEDECYQVSLKGYDHTKESINARSHSTRNVCSSHSNEKVSAVKQRGGGSWLLGFVRRDQEENEDLSIPALVRSASSSSLESSSTDDDSSLASSTSSTSSKKKGVCFNESVTNYIIPHSSTLTPAQRRRMYTSSLEVRANKIRNKKEYRYDGYDWRSCTEEWEMSVCMVTGELVHPVHSTVHGI
jgi:hypothetical protein|eukprot:scaffold43971_cov80-Cyclotella_meneghiniana.AAC.5